MFGFHVGKQGCIENMAKYHKEGFGCFQCFVCNPMNAGQLYSFSTTEQETAANLVSNGVHIYVHSSYVTYPWNNKPFSVHQIKQEVIRAKSISAQGYVIHLPRYEKLLTADESAVTETSLTVMDNIQKHCVLDNGPQILFEIQASSKNSKERLDVVLPEMSKRGFGLVVDTAHCWSSGIDVSDLDKFKSWFDGSIAEHCVMVHFNDSDIKLGGKKDVHAVPGKGKIWQSDDAFMPIISYLHGLGKDVIYEAVPEDAELKRVEAKLNHS